MFSRIAMDLWNEQQRDAAPTLYFNKSRRIKRTRKEHKCEICKGTIPAGSSCEEQTVMDSDCKKPGTMYFCDRCVGNP